MSQYKWILRILAVISSSDYESLHFLPLWFIPFSLYKYLHRSRSLLALQCGQSTPYQCKLKILKAETKTSDKKWKLNLSIFMQINRNQRKKNNMQKIIHFIKILFFFGIVLSPFFTGISGICKNKISYGSNQGKQFFLLLWYILCTSTLIIHTCTLNLLTSCKRTCNWPHKNEHMPFCTKCRLNISLRIHIFIYKNI